MNVKAFLAGFFVICGLLFLNKPAMADYQLDSNQLRAELAAVGIKAGKLGKIGNIPYLEVEFPDGKSVGDLCEMIPSLKKNMPETGIVIAISNRLHPDLIRGKESEPLVTNVDRIKIVLDTKVKSKNIFPEFDEKLAGKESHFIIDLSKQVMTLYEFGKMTLFLPVSTGKPGWETPKISGVVRGKTADLWLEKQQFGMSWVVKLSPTICVYGGLMDGMFTTSGSVKTYPGEAEKLFRLAKIDVTSFEIR
jgi:hypothetical protein